jgi:hypothetical protein
MAALPILTLWTFWPLRVAFLAAEPSMERLVKQLAAGKPIGFPRRVGVFRVMGTHLKLAIRHAGVATAKPPHEDADGADWAVFLTEREAKKLLLE